LGRLRKQNSLKGGKRGGSPFANKKIGERKKRMGW